MLNKYHFLKKLRLPSSKSLLFPFQLSSPYKYPSLPLQAMTLFKKSYSFSTSHIRDDINLLQHPSREQKEKISKIVERYALCKEDSPQLTSEEMKWVKWMLSGLWELSRNHLQKGDHSRAFEYLSEIDEIFQKLRVKDTIDVALNCYKMSSILISQEKIQAKKYLNEVDRICSLLGEDPQAKGLRVQSWHLLAQISSRSSVDKALELYNAVLENIEYVKESELPVLVHKEMGEIYLSRGDTENMVKSWENALQAAIKYFVKEDSNIDFNFMGDLANNPALCNQKIRAEPSAVQMALKSFPDPHEKVAVICCALGHIYLANNNFRQAVNYYDKAFKIFDKLPQDYSSRLYDVYFSMSHAQRYLRDSTQGVDFLKKAEGAIANAEQNLSVAGTYCRWAKVCSAQLDPFGTSLYYRKALELYRTLDPSNKARIFSIYEGWGEIVGQLYWGLPMDEEIGLEAAVEIWKGAEEHLDPTDHLAAQKVYINLEFLHWDLRNHKESEECVQKILQSCEATGDTSFAFSRYYNTGEHHEKKGELKVALPCYEVAARIYEKEESKDPTKAQNLAAKIAQIKEKLEANKSHGVFQS